VGVGEVKKLYVYVYGYIHVYIYIYIYIYIYLGHKGEEEDKQGPVRTHAIHTQRQRPGLVL
jgi:hypothetical protein